MSTNNAESAGFSSYVMAAAVVAGVILLVKGIGNAVSSVGILGLLVLGVGALTLWLWLLGLSARAPGQAPLELVDARPELVGVYETLSGHQRSMATDDVLLHLGLFQRDKSGSILRPTGLFASLGPYWDSVGFRPLPGTATAWERALPELRHFFGQPITLESPKPGTIELRFQHTAVPVPPPPPDPLANPLVLPMVPDPSWRIRIGLAETGSWVFMALANRAGIVVGGQPGSGKTASVQGMLAPLIATNTVQFAIVDGKGGGDWDSFSPRTFAQISTTDDLRSVVEVLTSIEAERARRVRLMRELRGTANFWDIGPTPDLPLLVVVIDECQNFLDRAYHASREARVVVERLAGLVSRLVAQGRSAGVFCVLATQKPTTDSVPAQARDNAGLRCAYSLSTRAGATAVLGDGWSEATTGVSPLGLATGVCIASDGGGTFIRVRSPFIADDVIAAHAKSYAYLTTDPRQVRPRTRTPERIEHE
jgi:hypothetical protein